MKRLSISAQNLMNDSRVRFTFNPQTDKMDVSVPNKRDMPAIKRVIKPGMPELLEIKQYLKAEYEEKRSREAERAARIAAIPGLQEIRAHAAELATWRRKFRRQMESEDGIISLPAAPADHMDELHAAYPQASAYLKAEEYTESSNYVKAAAGKKALERIIDGEDYEKAIAEMEAEWSAYTDEYIWD